MCRYFEINISAANLIIFAAFVMIGAHCGLKRTFETLKKYFVKSKISRNINYPKMSPYGQQLPLLESESRQSCDDMFCDDFLTIF